MEKINWLQECSRCENRLSELYKILNEKIEKNQIQTSNKGQQANLRPEFCKIIINYLQLKEKTPNTATKGTLTNESLFNYFKNFQCDIFQVLKAGFKNFPEIKTWNDISIDILQDVCKRAKEAIQIPAKADNWEYNNLIVSKIYIYFKKLISGERQDEFDWRYLETTTEKWIERHASDYEPHFYRAICKIITAIKCEEIFHSNKALDDMKRCLEKKKTKTKLTSHQYLLGSKENKLYLIPYNKQNDKEFEEIKSQLKRFHGRFSNENKKYFICDKKNIIPRAQVKSYSLNLNSGDLHSYNLCFTLHGLLAVNVRSSKRKRGFDETDEAIT